MQASPAHQPAHKKPRRDYPQVLAASIVLSHNLGTRPGPRTPSRHIFGAQDHKKLLFLPRGPGLRDVLVLEPLSSEDGPRGHSQPAQAAALGVRHPVQEGSGELLRQLDHF